jgi:anti-sigma factor RsiW
MTTTGERSCGFQDDLTAYVDRALDEGRELALEVHLAACDACRTELAGLVSLDETLHAYAPRIEASPTFASGFLAALDAEIGPVPVPLPQPARPEPVASGFWRWFGRPVLIPMSAAAVAIAVTVVTWPEGTPSGNPAPMAVVDNPNAVGKMAVRPAVAVDPRPTLSLEGDEKLPKAIQKVVRELDEAGQEKKLADVGAAESLETIPESSRTR